LPGGCGSPKELSYQDIGPFQVASDGTYHIYDAYNFHGVDLTVLIYSSNFNPGSPSTNLVTPFGIDVAEDAMLVSGTDYRLVVQQWCQEREGAWAVTFEGPGAITSDHKVQVPAFTSGTFGNGDPTMNSDCGNSQYKQSGPIQVSASGTYYYTDIAIAHAVDMCLQVYTAPVDPASPNANLVGRVDDFGTFELASGQDYYFVAQPLETSQTGAYFFVFAPPAPFRINAAMAGSWYNAATSGQGFFIDVFDALNQVFLAWFTFDLSRPDPAVEAQVGDTGHRWLTAYGPFEGTGANLEVEWTTGGVFDSAQPAPEQSTDGYINLEFTDCMTGTADYGWAPDELDVPTIAGQIPIQRIANDNVRLCESLYEGPDMPGIL